MGGRQHVEPELVSELHHDMLSQILGRFSFTPLFSFLYGFMYNVQ